MMISFSESCINSCNKCEKDSYHRISSEQLCLSLTGNDCPSSFLDIFSCFFTNCTAEYDEFIKPDISNSNMVDDIETCNYYFNNNQNSNSSYLYSLCWSDYNCFNAFFVNYDNLMNILSNNIDLLKNHLSTQIQTNYDILNGSINKYHCDSNYNNYIGNITCNDIFYNLMEGILNKCIFENDNNICYWSSCQTEINSCVYADDDQSFDDTVIESNPALCNQGLYWLSDTYFNKNNNDITLEYIGYIDDTNIQNMDCNDNSNVIQCYYYNIVGYCLVNMCPNTFWNIIDCIFKNECIGNGGNNYDYNNLDYSLSGTTLNIYTEDDICLIGTYRYYLSISAGAYNVCQRDWYKFIGCDLLQIKDNSTSYTQRLTAYSNYSQDIGKTCEGSSTNNGFVNGSFYVYPYCSNKLFSTSNNPSDENDRIHIYIVAIFKKPFNSDYRSNYLAYRPSPKEFAPSYGGYCFGTITADQSEEYVFGECKSDTDWSAGAYTSKSPTTSPPTSPPTAIPTEPPTPPPTDATENIKITSNYFLQILIAVFLTILY